MVQKRQVTEEAAGSDLPIKRRHLLSTIFKGNLQDYLPNLETIIRKWVKEEVSRAIDPFLSSSCNQIECSGSRSLHLQICNKLPHTLFTGSRIVSEDKNPIKIILCDSATNQIITSGPFSSIKVNVTVLDGDFMPDCHEDWLKKDFDAKVVQNREGKRPLVTGELTVPLQDGVGYIGEVIFTDNSSWIRSGRFRLGVKVQSNSDEMRITEGVSNAFKVKDHRGESYQKHYPPSLDDELWRLEKIAKDGASHKRLTEFGINCVRDFLREYVMNQLSLRNVLPNISKKTWETIVGHAKTCVLDEKKYMYKPALGTGLLFNSIYEVVGVISFDGQSYHSVDNTNIYQKKMVEDLKQHAYRNLNSWEEYDQLVVGYPLLLENPEANNFNSPKLGPQDLDRHVQQDQLDTSQNTQQTTFTPPDNFEVEQDYISFNMGESSQTQGFNQTFRNSFWDDQ